MANLTASYNWAISCCNAPDVGYSQDYRNKQSVNGITYYDCSSFIWYALLAGGFNVNKAYRDAMGTDYTWNAITTMYERTFLQSLGFREVNILGEWKPADILWRTGHTEMVHTGGTASGVSMGAMSPNHPLAEQVAIRGTITTASEWESLWRYDADVPTSPDASIYVVSAICGNFSQESTINPAIWEGLQPPSDWHVTGKGYGLGQWTNVGSGADERLFQLHQYLIGNGYSIDDAYGQLEFMMAENVWNYSTVLPHAHGFRTLAEFLHSASTDVAELTRAFLEGWEGLSVDHPIAMTEKRIQFANECYNFILTHYDDTSITTWYKGNRYLSTEERLNNAVLLYRYMAGGDRPTPPTPSKTKHHMPIWLGLNTGGYHSGY